MKLQAQSKPCPLVVAVDAGFDLTIGPQVVGNEPTRITKQVDEACTSLGERDQLRMIRLWQPTVVALSFDDPQCQKSGRRSRAGIAGIATDFPADTTVSSVLAGDQQCQHSARTHDVRHWIARQHTMQLQQRDLDEVQCDPRVVVIEHRPASDGPRTRLGEDASGLEVAQSGIEPQEIVAGVIRLGGPELRDRASESRGDHLRGWPRRRCPSDAFTDDEFVGPFRLDAPVGQCFPVCLGLSARFITHAEATGMLCS